MAKYPFAGYCFLLVISKNEKKKLCPPASKKRIGQKLKEIVGISAIIAVLNVADSAEIIEKVARTS